jgi:peptidyl-dipeptidase A
MRSGREFTRARVRAAAFALLPAVVACTADPAKSGPAGAREDDVTAAARSFLSGYEADVARLDIKANLSAWQASNTGRDEDYAVSAEDALALRKYHSDPAVWQRLRTFLQSADRLSGMERRSLVLVEMEYRRNQLAPERLERLVRLSKDIERTLTTFRSELDGQRFTNNDLLERLQKENGSARREAIWKALKSVGAAVAPKIVELAGLRNEAARSLGFANFWDMEIRLQEHDPQQLLAIFEDLERLTREPFTQAKSEIDRHLAGRFGVAAADLMPWHYDNPFFQDAPPSAEVNLDEFFERRPKEEIVERARTFYRDLGLPVEGVLRRSDLYEREGKDQHAFCTDIDRAGDVRILCNVKPNAEWMEVTLHELGHAVYELYHDPRLPYPVRTPAHAFATEGVAMLFGASVKSPAWLVTRAGADPARVREVTKAILEQRRREQLVFARWALVMLHFEKSLYENPQQDLSARWWETVTRFQLLRQPAGRREPDWASKPHFTIAPVYYHNYLLGELFAAQLRHGLAGVVKHPGPLSELRLDGRPECGEFLRNKVFQPGATWPWPEYVRQATGEPLTPRFFAAEVSAR